MKKPELLAPAGNMEKLKYAIHYGADAVYLAGKSYGLRAKAGNFTIDEIETAVKYVHDKGKKIYVAINIFPHNNDFHGMKEYIVTLYKFKIDGVIVADAGIIKLIKEVAPELNISLSTQANNTNYYSANFWHEIGINRIILARDLSIKEIEEIIENTPKTLQIETFVHGAMCISYSGRCLLSNYMSRRDANRGDCAHPCRWNYTLMEQTRENEYFPIYEDERGTYIFNSKDLCLIENIPDFINIGVDSLKIEGRMKSIFYLAVVVSIYRKVIDAYIAEPSNYRFDTKWLEELKKISHREYTKGFAFNKPGYEEQNYLSSSYVRDYDFVGVVLEYDIDSEIAIIEQRNKIIIGDTIEIISPGKDFKTQIVTELRDLEDNPLDSVPHPKMLFKMKINFTVKAYDMLRKAQKDK
ncbi:MAG: peptidase U32 family protein [Eubacteriaceae bacterium]